MNKGAVDRGGLGSDIVIGTTGCGVVSELVRNFDAYF